LPTSALESQHLPRFASPSSDTGAFNHIFFSFIATGDSSDEATATTETTNFKLNSSLQSISFEKSHRRKSVDNKGEPKALGSGIMSFA
jgi:hypothetical protein